MLARRPFDAESLDDQSPPRIRTLRAAVRERSRQAASSAVGSPGGTILAIPSNSWGRSETAVATRGTSAASASREARGRPSSPVVGNTIMSAAASSRGTSSRTPSNRSADPWTPRSRANRTISSRRGPSPAISRTVFPGSSTSMDASSGSSSTPFPGRRWERLRITLALSETPRSARGRSDHSGIGPVRRRVDPRREVTIFSGSTPSLTRRRATSPETANQVSTCLANQRCRKREKVSREVPGRQLLVKRRSTPAKRAATIAL